VPLAEAEVGECFGTADAEVVEAGEVLALAGPIPVMPIPWSMSVDIATNNVLQEDVSKDAVVLVRLAISASRGCRR
jgi:hypothetical protein